MKVGEEVTVSIVFYKELKPDPSAHTLAQSCSLEQPKVRLNLEPLPPSTHFRCCPFPSYWSELFFLEKELSGKFPVMTLIPSKLFSPVEITRTKLKQTQTHKSHPKAPSLDSEHRITAELSPKPPGFPLIPPSKLLPINDLCQMGQSEPHTGSRPSNPEICDMNRKKLYLFSTIHNSQPELNTKCYAKDFTCIISFNPRSKHIKSFTFHKQ